MKRSSWIGLIVAALLLGAGVFLFVSRQGAARTPNELIRASLNDAEVAAKSRSVNDVMAIISEDFQAGMWNKARLRLTLMRSMRDGRGVDYDVRVNAPRILPSPRGNPDERIVITRLSAFYSDGGEDIWGSGPLTLVMRKESRRRYLFFPEPYWRIVSVANITPTPLDL